jgi:catechol 2,3-dioxygenase-like lactoylglutathione lyase family enzyme
MRERESLVSSDLDQAIDLGGKLSPYSVDEPCADRLGLGCASRDAPGRSGKGDAHPFEDAPACEAGGVSMNPAPPSLQNLKKRAKLVLRQHVSGHVPVAERIRRGLPAFSGRTDREVLDARFTLSQAQELIARETGFSDWAQLKREIDNMSRETTPHQGTSVARPEVLGVHPQIFVTDMMRAVRFYRDELGFSVEYLYGEPPYYGLVVRDGAGLNLRHVDRLPMDAGLRDREALLAATIIVRNAKALFVGFKECGVPFHQTYREQPWGAHDFIVTDPDGNLIHFASRVGEP